MTIRRRSVEQVADQVITRDAANASSTARAKKPESGRTVPPPEFGWTKPDEPATPVQPEPPRQPIPDPRVGRTFPLFPFLVAIGIAIGLLVAGGLGMFGPSTGVVETPKPTQTLKPGDTPVPQQTQPAAATPSTPSTPPVAACDAASALELILAGTGSSNAICDGHVADGASDQVEYDGSTPAERPPTGDFVGTGLYQTTLTAQQASAVASQCTKSIFCAGTPQAGPYVVYVIDLSTPVVQVAGRFWEAGIGIFNAQPPGGVQAKPWDGAPADVFTGHNVVWTLRFPEPGIEIAGPFQLMYDPNGNPPFFMQHDSAAFVGYAGSSMVGFIPMSEWGMAKTSRFFSYSATTKGTGAGVDEAPNFDQPASVYGGSLPIIDLGE